MYVCIYAVGLYIIIYIEHTHTYIYTRYSDIMALLIDSLLRPYVCLSLQGTSLSLGSMQGALNSNMCWHDISLHVVL